MATERTRQAILVVLVVVLGGLLYRLWPGTSASSAPASNPSVATTAPASAPAAPPAQGGRGTTGQRGTAGQRGSAGQSAMKAPDVHLDSLEAEWPKPEGAQRNLFRFKPKAPPPPPPAPPVPIQTAPVVTAPPPPSGPPPPPPITLKFIGIIDAPESGRKIAVLSDGKNPPFQGLEGQIVEGRYRIIKIGVESVEIAYADGRGRQTIRLTGS